MDKFQDVEDGDLSWLSAAANFDNFDNEEQEFGKALENESVYMGKKLTTNMVVPGRLCIDRRYVDFYKEVLDAGEKILKIDANGYKVPFDKEPPAVF